MKISLIIPAYNPDMDKLMECLDSLISSNLKPYEIILVDDGSTVEYSEKIKSLCRIIKNKVNMGPAHARNRGAKEAKGDILCFVDSDVKVEKTTLFQIAEKFRSENIAAIQTLYSTFTPVENFISQYQNLYMHYNFMIIKHKYISAFASYCIAIKRDLFFDGVGFDEKVKTATVEDEHLGAALYAGGHKILLAKDITVQHLDYISFKRLFKRMFVMGRDWTEHYIRDSRNRNVEFSKSHHHFNLMASILISPLLLILFSNMPSIRYLSILLTVMFLMINARFFIFLNRHKGPAFMVKSIFAYYVVCLLIFIGAVSGTINVIKWNIKNISQKVSSYFIKTK